MLIIVISFLDLCVFMLLLSQRNAASTYNILNEEGRVVAAALLPYGETL